LGGVGVDAEGCDRRRRKFPHDCNTATVCVNGVALYDRAMKHDIKSEYDKWGRIIRELGITSN
jgi:hypothetical protein